MKNFFKITLLIIFLIICTSVILFLNYFGVVFFGKDLGEGYSKYRNKIYRYTYDELTHREILKNVDVETFEVGNGFAKDKNHIYYLWTS